MTHWLIISNHITNSVTDQSITEQNTYLSFTY